MRRRWFVIIRDTKGKVRRKIPHWTERGAERARQHYADIAARHPRTSVDSVVVEKREPLQVLDPAAIAFFMFVGIVTAGVCVLTYFLMLAYDR